jgi:IS30 family transposase
MPQIATNHYASAAEIAERWNVHRSTVGRIMARHGVAGLKCGQTDQSTRRFAWIDLLKIEKALGIPARTRN